MTRQETILGNARIVLADRVIERGWVAFVDGRIAEFGEGSAPSGSEDAGGDLIMPGLIELHTDHLEMHYVPRPKVFWDPIAAVVSYDGQLATSGITTVLDSLRVWREDGAEEVDGRAGVLAEAITSARDANLLRADHFLHLRCEIPMPSVVEEAKELIDRPDVRLMSLMDHTPGQRQFRDEVKLRDYYRGKGGGKTDAELDALFEKRFHYQKTYAAANMREIVALAHQYEIPLASHDDTTEENVADAIQDRVSVAEFPTTMEAARGLHQAGIGILMGAPNVVRGGSHSGNIAAVDLAREGLLDILSSDYIPSSLLMAALQLPRHVPAIDLAVRRPHGHQDAGRSRGPCGPRRDRGRQARRSDPGACRARHSGGAQRLAGRAAGGMTETLTTTTADQAAAIGPGRLVLVVGPSGAGKDTLLGLAKAACADDGNVVFPRRVITREASASEENEEVSIGTFQEALTRGEYAMHWEAHGHCYALSRAIDDEIRAGRTIVANVSRTVIGAMRRAYADVVVVLITAPPNVLAERIAMRARSSDGMIENRLRRTVEDASAAPDVTIVNTGSAEYHARQLVRVIKGEKWDE